MGSDVREGILCIGYMHPPSHSVNNTNEIFVGVEYVSNLSGQRKKVTKGDEILIDIS